MMPGCCSTASSVSKQPSRCLGLDTLGARLIDADPKTAKAAIYGLNRLGHRVHLLEEAWIVYALVREDHLTQYEAAQLLGMTRAGSAGVWRWWRSSAARLGMIWAWGC